MFLVVHLNTLRKNNVLLTCYYTSRGKLQTTLSKLLSAIDLLLAQRKDGKGTDQLVTLPKGGSGPIRRVSHTQ